MKVTAIFAALAAAILAFTSSARAELLVNPSNGPWIVNDDQDEDDASFPVSVTGTFPFFGGSPSLLYADVNGNLSLNGDEEYSDFPLNLSVARIAALWDDLYIYQHSGGQILDNGVPGQYVAVTWDYEDVYSQQGSGPMTFQAVIFQQPTTLLGNSFLPGDIVLSYKSLGQAFRDDTATVGLADGAGGEVVPAGSSDGTFSHAQALLALPTDNHAFLFRPNASNSYDLSTITLDFTGAAPYALPDNVHVPTGVGGVTLNVLANDYDPNGEPLTITGVTPGNEGAAAISPDGQSLLYTPNPALFDGNDTFTYTVMNSDGATSTATVRLHNLPPDFGQGYYQTGNQPVIISAPDFSFDDDGDTVFITAAGSPGDSLNTVSVNQDGTATFTPGPNFQTEGSDSFSVTVSDGYGGATVCNVIVGFVGQNPIAVDDTAVSNGQPVTIDVLANDSDPNNFSLTVIEVGSPTFGQTVINQDNSITYTPNASYDGADSFEYTISDGASSASAIVSIYNNQVLFKGSAVSGTLDPEISPAANWVSFKCLPDEISTDFIGVAKGVAKGSKSVTAVFSADGTPLVKVGDPVAGAGGAALALLEAPSGGVLIAKLKTGTGSPAVTTATEVVVLDIAGGSPVVVARSGEPPFDFVNFVNAAGSSTAGVIGPAAAGSSRVVYFTAKNTTVAPKTEITLWASLNDQTPVQLAAPGATVDGSVLASFKALQGSTGTTAEERDLDDSGNLYALLTFANKQQAIGYFSSADLTFNAIAVSGDSAVSGSGLYSGFGLPSPGDDSALAFGAKVTGAGVTTANCHRIYFDGYLAAQSGSPAPGAGGALFFSFSDPATGGSDDAGISGMAFLAHLKGAGLTSADNTGIWISTLTDEQRSFQDTVPVLVPAAIAGQTAPGTNGGIYASFKSLAVPNSVSGAPGAFFTGDLAVAGNISKANNFGLWAIDSTNTVRKIVQTGDTIDAGPFTATVKSFNALKSVGGTAGSGRGLDDQDHVFFTAAFTNGQTALIRATLPNSPPVTAD